MHVAKDRHKYKLVKTDDGLYKIIGPDGEAITDQAYSEVELFNDSRYRIHWEPYPTDVSIDYIFAVKEKVNWNELKSYYAIEFNGLFPFLYEIISLLYFRYQVKQNKIERWKFITPTAEPLTEAVYDEIDPFVSGIAFVQIRTKWGAIDKTGKEILPVKYDKLGFVLNFDKNANLSNLAYITVTIGGKSGIYSLTGEMLIEPIYTSLRLINWEAALILRKNHSFNYGYLSEGIEMEKFRKLPLDEMVRLLPRRHYFMSFDSRKKKENYLFCQTDKGFKKILYDEDEYLYDFSFLNVSFKTGTINMSCKNGYYEITSDGDLKKYHGYR